MKRFTFIFAILVVVAGLAGIVVGFMQYAFTGFPFGGGAEFIAEGHARAVTVMVISATVAVAGIVLAWLAWPRTKKPPSDRPVQFDGE